MKTAHLSIGTALLLSSCSWKPITCNLHELLSPPDARVAMIDGVYPGASPFAYADVSKDLYELNGVLYQKVTIQYAVANRPIIRRVDAPWGHPTSDDEMKEQFTIDSTIPEEVWMQPVGTWQDSIDGKKYVCIPATQFDFNKAKKTQKKGELHQLSGVPYQNNPGTMSTWRSIASTPLAITDIAANTAFFVGEGSLLLSGAIIALPFAPFVNMVQQDVPTDN
ncbi:MAG: hypothetical protein E7031_04365 [Akkermansiaceae bacterium]|nr:hypothetical protein [Akkermansiaceae bacterium]